MTQKPIGNHWTTIIRPQSGWFDLKLRELWQYRDLVMIFVRRDFVAQYKQTILGPLWYLIIPLFSTGVFTIVFGRIAQISTDGLPQFLFYMAGNVLWGYFSKILTSTSNTFIANAHLFGKVYFTRLTIPVSVLISGLISFGIQLCLFLGFVVYFYVMGASIRMNAWLLSFPYLLFLMAALGLGCGVVVSSCTTKYRDLQKMVGFGTQLLMYATPIIYPLSTVPEKYRWVVLANPMTAVVETFRYGFLGAGTVSFWHLAYSSVATIGILLAGIVLFNRVERTFMDTV
jgi:lipopolysaccharide transport system permease protein